ncbi:hypothetical protein AK812_SmicGene14134 [Symbiodinium microadriaticum]|uniref:Transmembrane protein n=1 Tax=Symbiodinium microadriaticum TaxID=2951 RepID=A0A1Q9E690_SYMMI|nr:hypothetical protein AK812_SmicGene14134 [Symbiodinium microadriaticum]
MGVVVSLSSPSEWLTNAGPNDVSSLQDSLAEYVQQQEIILDMYKLEDLEEAESFPWMFVAYGVMGLFLLCCACGAVYVHWSTRRKASGHNQGATIILTTAITIIMIIIIIIIIMTMTKKKLMMMLLRRPAVVVAAAVVAVVVAMAVADSDADV